MPVKGASLSRILPLTSSDGCGMISATFQLGPVPLGCNRLIVTRWISFPPRTRRASLRHSASSQSLLLVGNCFNLVLCTIPSSVGGARVQSDDHHVQANLPAAKTTTHTMRNRNIETAKLACFLNSLRPSLIRVVRRKKIERTKRKIGIAAARKAMILKIIVHCQCRVTRAASFDHLVGPQQNAAPQSQHDDLARLSLPISGTPRQAGAATRSHQRMTMPQPARPHTVRALLVFLHLLE
jgi:hypothetical protein